MPDTAQADPKAASAADTAARDERHHNRVFAFRCRSCGRLEEAGHAGEHFHPHACRVCNAGVVFGTSPEECFAHADVQAHEGAKAHAAGNDRLRDYHKGGRLVKNPVGPITVYKLLVPENWEVLADCDDARLAELGLARGRVCEHAPAPASGLRREPRDVTAAAADGAATADGAG
jgi:hypothetical protein